MSLSSFNIFFLWFLIFCVTNLSYNNTYARNWRTKKQSHQGRNIRTKHGLKRIAKGLSNHRNFNNNLDAILIQRTVGSRNHARVRNHITNVMRNNGWRVEEDSFRDQTPYGQRQFTNIIATLNPSATRRLVIACHYDSKIDPPAVYAIDSAVPCAMMLNLAKTMGSHLRQPNQRNSDLTLQFIFFDGEEAFVKWSPTDSLYGSRHLANMWENQRYTCGGVTGNQNDRIDLFVLLDLLGSKDMEIYREEASTARWYNRLVTIENNLKRKKLISGPNIFQNKDGRGSTEDDHIPFKRRGVPILHLIATKNVAPGFPSVWHTMGDNRSALDFKNIKNFNKILRVFVAEYLHIKP